MLQIGQMESELPYTPMTWLFSCKSILTIFCPSVDSTQNSSAFSAHSKRDGTHCSDLNVAKITMDSLHWGTGKEASPKTPLNAAGRCLHRNAQAADIAAPQHLGGFSFQQLITHSYDVSQDNKGPASHQFNMFDYMVCGNGVSNRSHNVTIFIVPWWIQHDRICLVCI